MPTGGIDWPFPGLARPANPMPHQTEPNANYALGIQLQRMLPSCRVRSEHTGAIAGHPGFQPDILITAEGRSPVVIEAEYKPAAHAEAEARARLGLEVVDAGRPIEAAIALRYPDEVGDADDLDAALGEASLSYCAFSQDRGEVNRFPESGWLDGSVTDLADLIRLMSVQQSAVDRAAKTLEEGIDRAERLLAETAELRPAIARSVAGLLGMTNAPHSRRMACAIIANALIFHERLAGMHDGVKPLELVCGRSVANPKDEILAAWAVILKINYWPIFAIARDIVGQLPAGDARRILDALRVTATEVSATGVDNAHDLTGRVFQRLIADRKYLATFYTLPASAALLARLAVAKLRSPTPQPPSQPEPRSSGTSSVIPAEAGNQQPEVHNSGQESVIPADAGIQDDEIDWSDPKSIGRLRIADFACGTGALLSAVYEQIAARHERAGGDAAALHPVMMEEVLYGCDVMPSAIHITGSTLAGAHPSVKYRKSRLYTVPYGRQRDGTVAIGSLELLDSQVVMPTLNTSDPARRTGSAGEETAAQIAAEIPDQGFDLVIMNPPFTSNTKHRDADDGVVNAAFAAFDATDSDQSAMAHQLKQRAASVCYHGHAGLASAFAALAEEKLRPNGVIALVLPFTAINGSSWAKFRRLIAAQYTNITVVSIAGVDTELSFSSDTDIGECLVIARKLARQDHPSRRGRFISLRRKPSSLTHAMELSKVIMSSTASRRLEDGPYGGIPIYCGDDLAGQLLDAPMDSHENGWGAARILDASVAQVAHSLSNSRLWLPAQPEADELPLAQLIEVGQRGVDHQFFVSDAHKAPFTKASASPTSTYPALWNHNAKKETRMACAPDSQMLVRPGMESAAARLWEVASRSHITQEFRFTSQPLMVAITDRESIGGRAWPNVMFPCQKFDWVFALWCNCTLGLLLFWWRSSRQQNGRGAMTINGIESLPVLDFRSLSDDQLLMAELIFDEFRDKDLKPAYLADADPNRALLDRRVVCDLLEFDETVYEAVRRLAAKWCAEPSVHGGKQRPRGASLIL